MAKKTSSRGGAIGKSLLYNRGVLYFIFILALGYLFYLSTIYDFYTLSIFVIIGFLTSFFSKNMIVILSLAMAVSFIFKFGTKIRPEGFDSDSIETKKSSEDTETNTKKKSVNTKKKSDDMEKSSDDMEKSSDDKTITSNSEIKDKVDEILSKINNKNNNDDAK